MIEETNEIALLTYLNTQHSSHFGQTPTLTLLFIGAGVITSLTLLRFNNAAQRLRLSTLEFFQYLAPSLQLGLASWFTISRLLKPIL